MEQDKATSVAIELSRAFVRHEASRYPVVAAWLFGSWAYGTPTESSDIDVALLLAGEPDSQTEEQMQIDSTKWDSRLDLHVYSKDYFDKARRAIIHQIKNQGIPLI